MQESLVKKSPMIEKLYANPLGGGDIERMSFEIIDREAPAHSFSPEEWQVVRRMVHTTADFAIVDDVKFSKDALAAAVAALRKGAPIYSDSNMIRAGLSLARLRSISEGYSADSISCYVADPAVAQEARDAGLPRSLFAVRKAMPILDGAIVLIGNAPVALMELNRLVMQKEVRPAVVIGVPVGFVHVVESKAELLSLDVPHITLAGRRGGSPLAVSILHALCSIAASRLDGAASETHKT